jgi:hypothetical protein
MRGAKMMWTPITAGSAAGRFDTMAAASKAAATHVNKETGVAVSWRRRPGGNSTCIVKMCASCVSCTARVKSQKVKGVDQYTTFECGEHGGERNNVRFEGSGIGGEMLVYVDKYFQSGNGPAAIHTKMKAHACHDVCMAGYDCALTV